MPFQESKWTSPNVISYIGSSKKDAASGQISATFFLLKNVNSTRVLIQKWCELAMCNKFNLLSGDSNIFQWCHFIEHRHDQSILSLLVKKYNHYYMCQIDHFSDELYANKLHSIYNAPIHTLRSLGETIVSE